MKNEWEALNDGRVVIWLQRPKCFNESIRMFTVVDEETSEIEGELALPDARISALRSNHKWYVSVFYHNGTKQTSKPLSNIIMQPKSGLVVDHIVNPDTLNNTTNNLRVVTKGENAKNRQGAQRNNRTTGERSITKNRCGRYVFQPVINGEHPYGGTYITLNEAITARDAWYAEHPSYVTVETVPSDAIWIPDSRSIFPIVPDHIYEKAGVLHLKPTLHTEPTLEASRV